MKIRKFLVGLLAALIALSSVAALADITIGVPDDTTNEARALRLLADNGIIELAEGAGETATKADVSPTASRSSRCRRTSWSTSCPIWTTP